MPPAADDVVFGANSFNGTNQTVTVDLPSIYVKSLTWTDPDGDAPTLEISSGNINIGGSLDIAPTVKLEIADPGNTYFNFISNDEMVTQTIALGTDKVVSGGFDLGNITFLGSGSWMLTTALNASGTIRFNKGSFEVEAGAPLYIYADEAIIDGVNMDLTLAQAIFQVTTFNLLTVNTFNAGTSNISSELFEVTPEAMTFHQVFLEGTEGELHGENLFFTDLTLNSVVKSTVYGSHTYYGELRFSQPGMIVEFEVDKVQNVNNITHPIPDGAEVCGGHLLVRSTIRGIQAIFNALPDAMDMVPAISVPNIILQDIMALP